MMKVTYDDKVSGYENKTGIFRLWGWVSKSEQGGLGLEKMLEGARCVSCRLADVLHAANKPLPSDQKQCRISRHDMKCRESTRIKSSSCATDDLAFFYASGKEIQHQKPRYHFSIFPSPPISADNWWGFNSSQNLYYTKRDFEGRHRLGTPLPYPRRQTQRRTNRQ
jgi:hypothetical protein